MGQITELGQNALGMGLIVLALGVLGWHRKLRISWALLLMIAMAIFGGVRKILIPSDLWLLPDLTGLGSELVLLLAWVFFGIVARIAGPIKIPGPPLLVATLAGALLGELAAAALLAGGARDRPAAARLALAAAGGGLIGRIGDPALLLIGANEPVWLLAPLGLACALIARPGAGDLVTQEGNRVTTGVAAGVALAALIDGLALPALVLGSIVMAVLGRSRWTELRPAPLTWSLLTLSLVLCATAGGLGEAVALGLEEAPELFAGLTLPLVTAVAALVTGLIDGPAASLLCVGSLDRALSNRLDHLGLAMAAGCAVGGLGPLLAAGALREGLRRWALQILLAIVYVALVL